MMISIALAIILCTMSTRETLAAESVLKFDQKWTDDFDGIVDRHVIRAPVPYSKAFYFLDRAINAVLPMTVSTIVV